MGYFFIHELFHLLIALLVGVLSFAIFKKKAVFLISLVVSLGVDLDHLFDYLSYFGLNLRSPITGPDYFCLSGKLFIPLHAWELLPLLFALTFIKPRWRYIFTTISLSLAGHFFLDQLSNGMYPLGYSLLFRLINSFDINAVSWGCLL